jgi:nitrite reductase/ring-hydroxylating ferredoxin subunit
MTAKNQDRRTRRVRKKYVACAADIRPGERRIVEVAGKSIGIFNVKGEYFALLNRCPHMGGNLCEGPITGTTLPTGGDHFVYGMEGELVRCGWHGWEFEIASGKSLVDPNMQVRAYQVTEEQGSLVVHI